MPTTQQSKVLHRKQQNAHLPNARTDLLQFDANLDPAFAQTDSRPEINLATYKSTQLLTTN
jgi:hypothetical protein